MKTQVLERKEQLAKAAEFKKACQASDCTAKAGDAINCKWGWECQAWRDVRSTYGLVEGID